MELKKDGICWGKINPEPVSVPDALSRELSLDYLEVVLAKKGAA